MAQNSPVKIKIEADPEEVKVKYEICDATEEKDEKFDDNEEKDEKSDDTEEKDEKSDIPVEELLQMKITLTDGSETYLFSYGPCTSGEQIRTLNCHLCRIGNIKLEGATRHLDKLLHKRNLRMFKRKNPERYNLPYRQFYGNDEEGKAMFLEILPGEDIEEVTKEYKDRIIFKASPYGRPKPEDIQILKQDKIHEYNKAMPLFGLGYLFKMINDQKIIYFCALCEMYIKGEAFQHIVGSVHQASYIINHFPNLYEKVKEALQDIKNEDAREQRIIDIFRNFYHKIELCHRKPKIRIVDFQHFEENRDEIITKCQEERHLGEHIMTFHQADLDKLVEKCLNGVKVIKPDLKSLAKPELGYRELIPVVLKRSTSAGSDDPPNKRRRPNFRGENYAAYQLLLENQLIEINGQYKAYETNPRSHPQYDQEWQRFRRERFNQLNNDKIDPRNHDFQSEWAPYWIQRLRQFYAKDLNTCKRELKIILNLPLDRFSSPPNQMDQQMQQESMQWQPQQQSAQHMFGAPNINQDHPVPIFAEDDPIESSEPLSIISVMRLLSALEDQLGSLGPKAVQLLSRAVLCEKDNGNTDELLLDNDYYVFFATVKEKFRGQLQAKLIDPLKVKAISHCIGELSAILEIMDAGLKKERERQRKEEEELKQQQQQKPQAQRMMGTFTDDNLSGTGRNQFGTNRSRSFGGSGSNFTGRSDIGSNPPVGNQDYRGGRNSSNWKRNAPESTSNLNRSKMGRIWVTGDNFRQNYSGGNDTFDDGNENSGANFGEGTSNFSRNFNSSNDNSGRNFSSGFDSGRNRRGGNNSGRSFGRNFAGGNDSGTDFSSGDISGRSFSTGDGGNNQGRNFGSSSFSSRNESGNFTAGNSFSSSFDNKNDNLKKNFGSGNAKWGSSFGTSTKDMERGFSSDNTDNFISGMDSNNRGNFGKSYGGGGNNSFNSNNNSGRNFGGNNSSSRGSYGNMNTPNRFNSGNSSREIGGQLFTRNKNNFSGKNLDSNNFGGVGRNFGMGQSSNFGRLMGFNSNN